MHVEMSQL